MPEQEPKQTHIFLTTTRLEALADCIFAFAMTLLVLNLAFPDSATGDSTSRLSALLAGHVNQFINYAIAFVLIALFWVVHHQQFHTIKRTDSRLIWINIIMLMFVVLLPFSTDLIGDFNGDKVADIFFACNLLIVGLFFLLNWAYATWNRRLVDEDLDAVIIKKGLLRNLVSPMVSLLVIAAAFIIPGYSMMLYWLVPLLLIFRPFK